MSTCPHMLYGGSLEPPDEDFFPKMPWESQIKIDDPHPPWGQHVDLIVSLKPVPGIQKLRIGPDGKIIFEEFHYKGGFSI